MGSDSDFFLLSARLLLNLKLTVFLTNVTLCLLTERLRLQAILLTRLRKNGFGVIICAAGMAAHLAGSYCRSHNASCYRYPFARVLTFDGMDALLATVQMPSGIPVATVAVDGAKNAAILAIQDACSF